MELDMASALDLGRLNRLLYASTRAERGEDDSGGEAACQHGEDGEQGTLPATMTTTSSNNEVSTSLLSAHRQAFATGFQQVAQSHPEPPAVPQLPSQKQASPVGPHALQPNQPSPLQAGPLLPQQQLTALADYVRSLLALGHHPAASRYPSAFQPKHQRHQDEALQVKDDTRAHGVEGGEVADEMTQAAVNSSEMGSGTRAPRDGADTPPSSGFGEYQCENRDDRGANGQLRILPLRIDPVTATGGPLQPKVYTSTCGGQYSDGAATEQLVRLRAGRLVDQGGCGDQLTRGQPAAAEDMPLVYKELVLGSKCSRQMQHPEGQAAVNGGDQMGTYYNSGPSSDGGVTASKSSPPVVRATNEPGTNTQPQPIGQPRADAPPALPWANGTGQGTWQEGQAMGDASVLTAVLAAVAMATGHPNAGGLGGSGQGQSATTNPAVASSGPSNGGSNGNGNLQALHHLLPTVMQYMVQHASQTNQQQLQQQQQQLQQEQLEQLQRWLPSWMKNPQLGALLQNPWLLHQVLQQQLQHTLQEGSAQSTQQPATTILQPRRQEPSVKHATPPSSHDRKRKVNGSDLSSSGTSGKALLEPAHKSHRSSWPKASSEGWQEMAEGTGDQPDCLNGHSVQSGLNGQNGSTAQNGSISSDGLLGVGGLGGVMDLLKQGANSSGLGAAICAFLHHHQGPMPHFSPQHSHQQNQEAVGGALSDAPGEKPSSALNSTTWPTAEAPAIPTPELAAMLAGALQTGALHARNSQQGGEGTMLQQLAAMAQAACRLASQPQQASGPRVWPIVGSGTGAGATRAWDPNLLQAGLLEQCMRRGLYKPLPELGLPHGTDQERRKGALAKFQIKRKSRSYGPKVRYLTRKKLAQARPRVKGQFVKQEVAAAYLASQQRAEEAARDAARAVERDANEAQPSPHSSLQAKEPVEHVGADIASQVDKGEYAETKGCKEASLCRQLAQENDRTEEAMESGHEKHVEECSASRAEQSRASDPSSDTDDGNRELKVQLLQQHPQHIGGQQQHRAG